MAEPKPDSAGLNLHLYPSRFAHRTRILKQIRAIWDWGYFDEIHVIAIHDGILPKREKLGPGQWVHRLTIPALLRRGGRLRRVLAHLAWMVQIYRCYAKQPVRCINCHNLGILPLGVVFKIMHNCTLIYDAHELETQRNGWPGWLCGLTGWIERFLIRWVDQLIVVGPAIGHWYQQRYQLPDERLHVVRNIPAPPRLSDQSIHLKQRLGIPTEHILCLYVGLLDSGRNIPMMLDCFAHCARSDIHLLMLGYGPLTPLCQTFAQQHATIHHHPAVPPDQVVNYVAAADLGLVLIENSCLSYYYCLPNKLFECLLAGVPVLVSDFPEMGHIVDQHNSGWSIPPDNNALSAFLDALDVEALKSKRQGALHASTTLSWPHETEVMQRAYRAQSTYR